MYLCFVFIFCLWKQAPGFFCFWCIAGQWLERVSHLPALILIILSFIVNRTWRMTTLAHALRVFMERTVRSLLWHVQMVRASTAAPVWRPWLEATPAAALRATLAPTVRRSWTAAATDPVWTVSRTVWWHSVAEACFLFCKNKRTKEKIYIWKAIVREFKWNYSIGEQITDVLEADWNISAVYRWPVLGPWSECAVPLSAWLHWCQLPSQHWWLCFSPLPECRNLSRWFEWLHLLLHAGLHWQELQRAIRCLWRTSVPKWWHMLHPLYRTSVPVPKGLHGAKLWVHIAEQLQARATPNFPPFLDHHHHLLHTDCPAAGSGGGCYLHEEKEDTAGQETAERHCCLQWSGDS